MNKQEFSASSWGSNQGYTKMHGQPTIKKNAECLNLGFLSPCFITLLNELTNQMQKFLKFITWHLNTAQRVSGILMPIIRSSTTAVAASGFTVEAWR